jgi:hypothetical protein
VTEGGFENDGDFGTEDDRPIFPFSPDNVSRIASVIIKGAVNVDFDDFGIVAGRIVEVKVGGSAVPLTNNLDVFDVFDEKQGRVTVREISYASNDGTNLL